MAANPFLTAVETPSSFSIMIEPVYGLYIFVVATVLSLAITHVILHYHRKTKVSDDGSARSAVEEVKEHGELRAETPLLPARAGAGLQRTIREASHEASERAQPLYCFAFQFPGREGWAWGKLRLVLRVAVAVLAVVGLVCVTLGVTAKAFSFKFVGLAGGWWHVCRQRCARAELRR